MIQTLTEERIAPSLQATSKKGVLQELAELFYTASRVASADELYGILQEREDIGSTGIGEGIAIPHGKVAGLNEIVIFFGRSKEGVNFEATDNKPVHLFFLLLAPVNSARPYLNTLAALARFLKSPSTRTRLLQAADTAEILSVLKSSNEFI